MSALDQQLPSVRLLTPEGESTTLAEQRGDAPALVVMVRYYGCLPCQHYVVDLHRRREELDRLGVGVVVVGVAADFQARHLAEAHGVGFPLLLDPEQQLYRALELRRLRPLDMLRPRTWRHYVPLFIRRYLTRRSDGPTQGRIAGDPMQMPGLALLDADGRLRWVHRGERLGDYPPLERVITEIGQTVASTAPRTHRPE